jgi:hypothetical protein
MRRRTPSGRGSIPATMSVEQCNKPAVRERNGGVVEATRGLEPPTARARPGQYSRAVGLVVARAVPAHLRAVGAGSCRRRRWDARMVSR